MSKTMKHPRNEIGVMAIKLDKQTVRERAKLSKMKIKKVIFAILFYFFTISIMDFFI